MFTAFNLHFQEPPFLTRQPQLVHQLWYQFFQSPFSGASLSYFSEISIALINQIFFQSPFSGASLSYTYYTDEFTKELISFNLHFQEPPFLTSSSSSLITTPLIIFQSPFSGASLSYLSVIEDMESGERDFQSPFSGASLSYSRHFNEDAVREDDFQSPFSGASLSYAISSKKIGGKEYIFQSPFSGASLSYRIYSHRCHQNSLLSISIFRSLPFLLVMKAVKINGVDFFQSPFSGASLSYFPIQKTK
ncbi:predicted coding region AF_1881 [Archaeoglobus fulgidus DSM 4304]|nr:RecName: Full=Uncharacterized protein AF_1881 [Archaeoglobus fulgidus DSM 4304]AAB89379.1 predicted coding region AF_1881 [Archaeoglobus fulgidus DSM 4304]